MVRKSLTRILSVEGPINVLYQKSREILFHNTRLLDLLSEEGLLSTDGLSNP